MLHKGASGAAKEFEAELVSGTVVLSATAESAAEIVASSARIRPMAEMRGVVQVGIAGPHELIVFARQGRRRFPIAAKPKRLRTGSPIECG
jgi:hypothetical protein